MKFFMGGILGEEKEGEGEYRSELQLMGSRYVVLLPMGRCHPFTEGGTFMDKVIFCDTCIFNICDLFCVFLTR